MTLIGIDPGLSGAVAVLARDEHDFKLASSVSTPTLSIMKGKSTKRDYQIAAMRELLLSAQSYLLPCHAILEKVHAMPGNGATSMFSFGRGLGVWEGLLTALEIPYTLVAPQTWQKAMLGDMTKDKEASRLRAQQLFPTLDLSKKSDHGRADALLLAEYGRRTLRAV